MIRAVVTQDNPATILARVIDQTGNAITQSSVSAITVTVYNAATATSTGSDTPAVADCVFDTMQTDARWTTDKIGYNLAVDIDGDFLNAGNTLFQVEIAITPTSGEVYRLVSILQTQSIFS